MKINVWAAALCAVVLSFPASAAATASTGSDAGSELNSLEEFQERRAMIEENFGDGGAYMEISGADRTAVRSSLETMEQLLATHRSIDAMSPDARLRLFNEQEAVNELLTQAARDSRLFCERRGRVGTHFKTTVCETYVQRQRRRDEHQMLYRATQPIQLPDLM